MDTSANTITTMGLLSSIVYNDNIEGINYFQKDYIFTTNSITYKVLAHESTIITDFQGLLLQEVGTENYVVAFRGTESFTDGLVDLVIAGHYNAQYSDAVDFVNSALARNGISENNLTLTGHSLGGILTQQVGATLGIKGYAYNPLGANALVKYPPTTNPLLAILSTVNAGNAINWAENNILNISYQDDGVLNGDVLSNLATYLSSTHLGQTIPVFGVNVGGSGHFIDVLNNAINHYNEVLSHFTQDTTFLDLSEAYVASSKITQLGYEKTEQIFTELGVYNTSNLTLDLLIDKTPAQLNNKSLPNLYALLNSNPFAIQGNLSAYSEINPDDYSPAYMTDRADYLYYILDKENRYGFGIGKDIYKSYDSYGTNLVGKGSTGNQVIFGTDNVNNALQLNGGNGDDRIYGLGGDDEMMGNAGNDYLEGGAGNDILYGGSDSDALIGGADSDTLEGGKGDDTLIGGTESGTDDGVGDTLKGGDGFDTYIAGNNDFILDSDGKGNVLFDGIDLSGRKKKNKDSGLYEDDDYIYDGNPKGTGTLTVRSKNGSESITISDWENKELGIELVDNSDIEVSITKEASTSEGNSGTRSLSFTVSLSRVLEDGETLEVSVSSTDEGSYTFQSGEQSKTFTHSWSGDTEDEGAIDHIATLTPSANYIGTKDDVKVTIKNSGTATVYDDDGEKRHDPLALDMDKDGFISTTSLEESSTYFDITGDGLKERVGWIQSNDALVTYDKNDNGQIDGIDEVFGNLGESGFEELKRLIDSNHDNKIDRRDELYQRLQVWNDVNQDAKVQDGELKSLSEAGVKSIDLNYVATNIEINANLLVEASKYTNADGEKELVADIQLATDAKDTKVDIEDIPNFTIDQATYLLPELKGTGLVYDSFIKYNIDPEFKALATEMNTNISRIATEFDSFIEQYSGYTAFVNELQERYSVNEFEMVEADKKAWIVEHFEATDKYSTNIENYYHSNLTSSKVPTKALISNATMDIKYQSLADKLESSFAMQSIFKDVTGIYEGATGRDMYFMANNLFKLNIYTFNLNSLDYKREVA